MKRTKKKIAFFILQAIFTAVIPLVLVIIQYSNLGDSKAAVGFKLEITGILLILIVFWIIKKLFADGKIADLKAQNNVMLAGLKTKQDEAEIKALEREIRYARTIEVIYNSIIPILFLIAAIIAFKALEAQLIKLSGTMGLIIISIVIGTIFNVLHAREVHAKERKGDVL